MGLIVCADFYHEKHAFIDIAYFLKKKKLELNSLIAWSDLSVMKGPYLD